MSSRKRDDSLSIQMTTEGLLKILKDKRSEAVQWEAGYVQDISQKRSHWMDRFHQAMEEAFQWGWEELVQNNFDIKFRSYDVPEELRRPPRVVKMYDDAISGLGLDMRKRHKISPGSLLHALVTKSPAEMARW